VRIGYARVSTEEQNLDMQVDALEAAGCDKIFSEKVSGTGRKQQPELERVLDLLRPGDALVIYKLDRLGRSTSKMIKLAEELQQRQVELISLQDSIDTTTATGKLVFRVLCALSEMETDLLSERTRAGLQAARRRGRVGGRPRVSSKQVDAALKLYNSRDYTVTEIGELTGIKPATLYRYLKQSK
jgi:DNA invertase Pin-like site-specific DNA recombinase